MTQNTSPILVRASASIRARLGHRLGRAARDAVRTVLLARGPVEIAHQQIRVDGFWVAFSTHVGQWGDLVVTLDVGDPGLAERQITEAAYRDAALARRHGAAGKE